VAPPPGHRPQRLPELVYTTSEVIRELVAAEHLATVNSVVKVTELMYVRCDSGPGHIVIIA
jgi:hypothetical protein